MDINEAVTAPAFGRHESFHPRYGWLKKAYDLVAEQSDVFRADNATVRFGVGKNMVRAIRFWSLAFKVTADKSRGTLKTTRWGDNIFDNDNGIDPYLERPETFWILHWLLFAPPCIVPTWWIIINQIQGAVISGGDLLDTVQNIVKNNPKWKAPSPVSVKRDVDVFFHTYTSKRDKLTVEEYIDCPFRNLRLARHDSNSIRFTFGPKTGLAPSVVAFACADFADRVKAKDEISVARLAMEPGSVGSALKMNEGDLTDSLEAACNQTDCISISRINGAPHLIFADGADTAAQAILILSYRTSPTRDDGAVVS